MKNIYIKSILMVICTVGCMAGCILLNHIKEEHKKLLLSSRGAYIADEDLDQSNSHSKDMRQYLLHDDYAIVLEELEKKLSTMEEELQFLQLKSNIQQIVEEKESENTNPYMVYEKYFRLKQGELARIEERQDLSACGTIGFLNSHFGGVTFEIENGVAVQYRNDSMSQIWEYELPRTIFMTEPDMNIGFMKARAGMNFMQIQANAYEAEVQEGYLYFEENIVYYIKYVDEFYEYTFVSEYSDGRDSWLMVEKAM